jgi:hypothetical protein
MNGNDTGRSPGCLTMLAGPLLAFGLWMIAQALLLPHEAEAVRLSIVTGAFATLVGGWLLAQYMRRVFTRRDPASAPAPPPAPGESGLAGRAGVPLERLAGGLGCLVIPAGFLLCGAAFLYLYFSGAPTRRGNPLMGLFAGVLFGGLGLLGLWMQFADRRQNSRRHGRKDPPPLP